MTVKLVDLSFGNWSPPRWAVLRCAEAKEGGVSMGMSEREQIIRMLPTATCLMTGAFESARAGAIVPWAMQCSREPLCICVALYKGNRLSPMVRDSRVFGLCLIDGKSKLLVKRFGDLPAGPAKPDADPFIACEMTKLVSEAPILMKCVGALDCQVIRHLDFDGDHEMYIGQVVASRLPEV